MKRLQGKLQQSKLVRLSSHLSRLMASLADTLLSTEAKQSTRHKQLVPMSPVTKKPKQEYRERHRLDK